MRPKAGWEEFCAARARVTARLAAQTEIARLELTFSLELEGAHDAEDDGAPHTSSG